MGVRPMKVDPNVLRGIANMSKKDQARLTQCIFCSNDPRRCGCTEADETEDGFCKKYIDRGLTNDSNTYR